MIHHLASHVFLGFPVVAYLGILTFLSFAFTASIGYASHKSIKYIPFKWHPVMVGVSFGIALVHVFFALSVILGY
jgi:hypothetical protein